MTSTVTPYSLRAPHRPTVSTPVTWDEIDAALAARDASALVASPGDALDRRARHGDVTALPS